jgi:8-hydroxy-5-deazaflavin:NADPH oxidoreductase
MRMLRSIFLLPILAFALSTQAADGTASHAKIGIIGSGKIGGTLAALWVKSGHEVMISSRHPEELQPLAKKLGPKARVGTPAEAASFGDVVVVSVPYHATPDVGRDYARQLAGKVVLDTGNPYPERDGDMANLARQKGAGPSSQEFLPGTKLVRAYNAIKWTDLRDEAGRTTDRIGIPIASNDTAALKVAAALVRDSGFDPVVVGDLSQAKRFDVGSPVYVKLMTGKELRAALAVEK